MIALQSTTGVLRIVRQENCSRYGNPCYTVTIGGDAYGNGYQEYTTKHDSAAGGEVPNLAGEVVTAYLSKAHRITEFLDGWKS
jgi:hypothetical protein